MTDLTASLGGRAALVTGASRGIGHAIAAELLSRGASVTITARKPDELRAAAKELVEGPAGGAADRVLAVAGNAGSAESRAESVDRTMATFGRLDILINNTGINPVYGPLVDADLDAVRKIFDLNVVAAIGYVQLAYRAWMRDNSGSVVNLASVGGLRSTGVIAAYGASKAALIRLTEELAWQLGPSIRVNAVAPGVIKTKFAAALYAEGEDKVSAAYPMKRLGNPEDVAALVGFLVSDQASWITGETVRWTAESSPRGPWADREWKRVLEHPFPLTSPQSTGASVQRRPDRPGQHVQERGGLAVGERGDVVDHGTAVGGRRGAELGAGELDQVVQARREAGAVALLGEPRGQAVHQRDQHGRLSALVGGEVRAAQHEALVHELEHRHLVPLRHCQRDVGRAHRRVVVDGHPRHQARRPTRRELRDRPLPRHRPVERHGQQSVDQVVADACHGGAEGVVVVGPGILVPQAPPQPLQVRTGAGRARAPAVSAPARQLGGHPGLLQHADAVEVLQIVDGVGDVVGGVHHGCLHRLLPRTDRERRPGGDEIVQLGGVRGELGRARGGCAGQRTAPARRQHGGRGCGSG